MTTSYDAALTLGPRGERLELDLADAECVLDSALSDAEASAPDVSVRAALNRSPDWKTTSGRARRKLDYLVNAKLEQEYGCTADALSARYGDDVDWLTWLGPESGLWGEWLSLARGLGVPVLIGFNAAEQAARHCVGTRRATCRRRLSSVFLRGITADVCLAEPVRRPQDAAPRASCFMRCIENIASNLEPEFLLLQPSTEAIALLGVFARADRRRARA